MIFTLIALLAYIFYAEFMADTVEPFFKKLTSKEELYQKKIPKSLAVEMNEQ